jgi:hypothetical protein
MDEERRGFAGFEALVTDLSDLPPLPPEPARPPVGHAGGTRASGTNGAGAVAGVCLFLFFLFRIVMAVSDHNSHTRPLPFTVQPGIGYTTPPVVTYTPPPGVGYTPLGFTPAPARAPPWPVVQPEQKPPVGDDVALSPAQLHYCVAQGARLDGSQKAVDMTSKTDIDRFNALVDDFNARCGKYRYGESAMQSVKAQVNARRGQLEKEGAALIRSPVSR